MAHLHDAVHRALQVAVAPRSHSSRSAEHMDDLRRRCSPKGEHEATAATAPLATRAPRGAGRSIHLLDVRILAAFHYEVVSEADVLLWRA